MSRNSDISQISHLMCREIQAPLVSAIIKGFSQEFGAEKVYSVAKKIICSDAVLSGKTLAERYSGNSLKEMLRIVEEVWAVDGIMEIDNVSLTENELKFDVTRCGYADMYEKLGIKELGTLMSCCRDYAFMDGFNTDIELIRTKTIMEGNDICDFYYKTK